MVRTLKKYAAFLVCVLNVVLFLCGYSRVEADSHTLKETSLARIVPDRGWEAHWGDIQLNNREQSAPFDATIWEPYSRAERQDNILWLRRRLPEEPGTNPAIFLPRFSAHLAFDVYLEHSKIYTSGEFRPAIANRHRPILWHMIPLPSDFAGKTLLFRFYSDRPDVIGVHSAIWFGDEQELIRRFMMQDLDVTILAVFFVLLGVSGIIFWIKGYQGRNFQLLSFTVMAVFSGVYNLVAESDITQYVLAQPVILSYLRFISFFLWIAGFWGFFELTTGIGPKNLYRFMRYCYLAGALSVFPLGILHFEMLETIFNASMMLAMVGIVYSEIQLIIMAARGDLESRLLSVAFGVFGMTGVFDILEGFALVEQTRMLSIWGLLVVLMSQAYLFVSRYQTEVKRLREEAAHAAHLASLGELAAGVAHEINNPLNSMINYAQIMADNCDEQGASTDVPQRIIREGNRIAKIVRNLLAFARDQKQEFRPAQIQEMLADTLMLTAKTMQQSGIRIRLDVPQELPLVLADNHQIQQVFTNLMNNARYALEHDETSPPEEKCLDIWAAAIVIGSQHYVRTIFFDNGPGIAEEHLEKVCEPFYSTKPRNDGTGLGLSISYGIVREHRGHLAIESRTGEYTRVLVDLPVWTGERKRE
jgi:signal transduction histidine kinase